MARTTGPREQQFARQGVSASLARTLAEGEARAKAARERQEKINQMPDEEKYATTKDLPFPVLEPEKLAKDTNISLERARAILKDMPIPDKRRVLTAQKFMAEGKEKEARRVYAKIAGVRIVESATPTKAPGKEAGKPPVPPSQVLAQTRGKDPSPDGKSEKLAPKSARTSDARSEVKKSLKLSNKQVQALEDEAETGAEFRRYAELTKTKEGKDFVRRKIAAIERRKDAIRLAKRPRPEPLKVRDLTDIQVQAKRLAESPRPGALKVDLLTRTEEIKNLEKRIENAFKDRDQKKYIELTKKKTDLELRLQENISKENKDLIAFIGKSLWDAWNKSMLEPEDLKKTGLIDESFTNLGIAAERQAKLNGDLDLYKRLSRENSLHAYAPVYKSMTLTGKPGKPVYDPEKAGGGAVRAKVSEVYDPIAKNLALDLIPFGWTRNWDQYSDAEKGINLLIDLVLVGIPLGKLAGKASAKAIKDATTKVAGNVGNITRKQTSTTVRTLINVQKDIGKGTEQSIRSAGNKLIKLSQTAPAEFKQGLLNRGQTLIDNAKEAASVRRSNTDFKFDKNYNVTHVKIDGKWQKLKNPLRPEQARGQKGGSPDAVMTPRDLVDEIDTAISKIQAGPAAPAPVKPTPGKPTRKPGTKPFDPFDPTTYPPVRTPSPRKPTPRKPPLPKVPEPKVPYEPAPFKPSVTPEPEKYPDKGPDEPDAPGEYPEPDKPKPKKPKPKKPEPKKPIPTPRIPDPTTKPDEPDPKKDPLTDPPTKLDPKKDPIIQSEDSLLLKPKVDPITKLKKIPKAKRAPAPKIPPAKKQDKAKPPPAAPPPSDPPIKPKLKKDVPARRARRPKIRRRLRPDFELPDNTKLKGKFPRVVKWNQGFTEVTLDIDTGKASFKKSGKPGTPVSTFQVLKTDLTKPKKRKYRLGIANISVTGTGLKFGAPAKSRSRNSNPFRNRRRM